MQSQGAAEKRYRSVTKQLTSYKRFFGAKVLYCRHCYDSVLEVSKHRTLKQGSMALLEALNSERNPWPFVEFVAYRDCNGCRL